jgi:hypothetical protein
VLKFFYSPKKDIIFYKIFFGEKIFIESPYHKIKIKNTHLLSPNTPSHTTKRIIPRKIKMNPLSCLEKQSNFSFPCHPRNNPLG